MGSANIGLRFKGQKTAAQINKLVNEQRKEDREYNGHREGYSGDWQTIHDIEDHTDKIFDSVSEADEYCLRNTEKGAALIVYYKSIPKTEPQYISKLKDKLTALRVELDKQPRLILDGIKSAKSKTIGCKTCSSSISRKYLTSVKCPICSTLFITKTQQNKLDNITNNITLVNSKLRESKKKIAAKCKNINTMVAGWAAE